MFKLRTSHGSLALAGIAAVTLFAACSGDTSSSEPDAETSPDASSGVDTGTTGTIGSGDSAMAVETGVIDTNDGGMTTDSGQAFDVGRQGSDAADSGPSNDGAPVADDAGPDVSIAVDTAPDVSTSVDTDGGRGGGGPDATITADAAPDATIPLDAAPDAAIPADATTPADASSTADAASDAGDAIAGPLYDYSFDSDLQGYSMYGVWIPTYPDGAPTPIALNSTVTYSSSAGISGGAARVYAAFDDSGEKCTSAINYPPPYVDMTNRTLSISLYLASGSQQYTYFYVFAMDQDDNWIDPGPSIFPAVVGGQWTTVTLDISHPQGYASPLFNASKIRTIGVELDSGSGNGPGSITPVTVYIDNIVVQ